jgi:hypothetical protein
MSHSRPHHPPCHHHHHHHHHRLCWPRPASSRSLPPVQASPCPPEARHVRQRPSIPAALPYDRDLYLHGDVSSTHVTGRREKKCRGTCCSNSRRDSMRAPPGLRPIPFGVVPSPKDMPCVSRYSINSDTESIDSYLPISGPFSIHPSSSAASFSRHRRHRHGSHCIRVNNE